MGRFVGKNFGGATILSLGIGHRTVVACPTIGTNVGAALHSRKARVGALSRDGTTFGRYCEQSSPGRSR